MFRGIIHLARLTVIGTTLARYGALPFLRNDKPQLARALESLGPSFIKLGQTLSTRADLIGDAMAEDLANLRDRLPPFPAKTARAIIEKDLGKTIDELFTEFDDTPVAAASVAQVHKATTKDGRKVAVKIIRPGVGRAFERDMRLFYWCARLLQKCYPRARRLKPVEIVQTLEQSVAFELDLRYEAAAITEMRANAKGDKGIRIPFVDWKLSAERVLVTEWIDGTAIHEVEKLKAAGYDLNQLLATLSGHFFKQVFRDGFFHADLHPGNVLVDNNGNITFIDFGIMGRLDWKERLYVAEIFRGFLNEDFHHVAEVHFRAGYVPSHHSVELFAQASMAIAKPVLDRPVHEVSLASLLGQLFKVTQTFQMETQPQLLLLQKTMVVVEGLGRMLNSNVNMWEMARTPIEEWAHEHLGLKGKIRHTALDMLENAEQLPEILSRIDAALKHFSDPRGLRLNAELDDMWLKERIRFRRQMIFLGWAALLLGALALYLHH